MRGIVAPAAAKFLTVAGHTKGTNEMTSVKLPPMSISPRARTRLAALISRAEPSPHGLTGPLTTHDLLTGSTLVLRQAIGIDLSETGFSSADELCRDADEGLLLNFLCGCYAYLKFIQRDGKLLDVWAADFERLVNEILKTDGTPVRLRDTKLVALGESDAEVLRRTLLEDPNDLASCQQGDVQVEMVVSSVQAKLSMPGAVLVDYGVGLGRVLGGLASAHRFTDITYVAVDDPIPAEVLSLAGQLGTKAVFKLRKEYLAQPDPADVIFAVNVLHHIPFRDIPAQISTLLSSLKPSGFLLIHEMCELREPEQGNVPWRIEDILRLLQSPSLDVNPRTTVSKGKKVPLANVLISRKSAEDLVGTLSANVREVWRSMKARTLDEIRQLYAYRDGEQHAELQHLLIINANLDLNSPDCG
jgi:hypothetical protein